MRLSILSCLLTRTENYAFLWEYYCQHLNESARNFGILQTGNYAYLWQSESAAVGWYSGHVVQVGALRKFPVYKLLTALRGHYSNYDMA